jgi:hypothetical protein
MSSPDSGLDGYDVYGGLLILVGLLAGNFPRREAQE